MSRYQKFSLGLTLILSVTYLVFFLRMTDGLVLADHTASSMAWLLILLIVFLAICAIIWWIIVWSEKNGKDLVPDEREFQIEIRSESSAYWTMEIGISVVVAFAIAHAAYGETWLGSYSLMRPEGLVFALVSVIALAGIVRALFAFVAGRG